MYNQVHHVASAQARDAQACCLPWSAGICQDRSPPHKVHQNLPVLLHEEVTNPCAAVRTHNPSGHGSCLPAQINEQSRTSVEQQRNMHHCSRCACWHWASRESKHAPMMHCQRQPVMPNHHIHTWQQQHMQLNPGTTMCQGRAAPLSLSSGAATCKTDRIA